MPIKWILPLALSFSLLSAQGYTLDQLCKKGIANNSKMKSFAHRTSASNSYYDQSIDQYKPHFNIAAQVAHEEYTLGYAGGEQPYSGISHQYTFSVRQPIYQATLLDSMKDAKERIVLSKLMEEDEKAKLITDILQSTFELKKQKKKIQILMQKEQILQKAHANIEKKHELRFASKVDQYQSLSALNRSQSDLSIATQTYHSMLFNLKMLTKIDNIEKYIETLEFDMNAVKKAFRKNNLSEFKSKYTQNTRVKLEKQTVKISNVQIDLRKDERHPKVDAVVSYGDSGGTLDATVRQKDTRAMITLNFPLYQGGYVSDRVEEARYLALAAQESAEDIETNIKISLEKTVEDIRSGIESVNAEKVAVEASKKYFEAADESYRNGLGSLTDAYLAEATYDDSRLRLVDAESMILSSLAEMYYYSGMSSSKDIEKLQKIYFR